jgi:hypothetical protein
VTRLVVVCYSQYMDRDGGNCFVGVRRIADDSGYDKSTVAKHRSIAIEQGWLMVSSHSRHSRRQFVMPSVPDDFPAESETGVSGLAGQSLSTSPGQLSATVSRVMSSTVRVERPQCPAGPDLPAIPVLPLGGFAVGSQERQLELLQRQASLLSWILNDETAKKYGDSSYALALLAPSGLRFKGYEEFLERVGRLHPNPPPATGGGK